MAYFVDFRRRSTVYSYFLPEADWLWANIFPEEEEEEPLLADEMERSVEEDMEDEDMEVDIEGEWETRREEEDSWCVFELDDGRMCIVL